MSRIDPTPDERLREQRAYDAVREIVSAEVLARGGAEGALPDDAAGVAGWETLATPDDIARLKKLRREALDEIYGPVS